MQRFLEQKQLHAANSERVMEAETISKNGASPKSQMSRRNLKLFALFILVAGIFAIKSCKDDPPVPEPEPPPPPEQIQTVSQNVIELVNEPEEFPEKEEFARTEEIVEGSERSGTIEHDTTIPRRDT